MFLGVRFRAFVGCLRYGVPITIVCTKADQIDAVAEELGFGGGPAGGGGSGGKGGGSTGGKGGWEERTDWIGQVLRLVALMRELFSCVFEELTVRRKRGR